MKTEVFKHKCFESEKVSFKMAAFLTHLKENSQGIIKSFDMQEQDVIHVEYLKIEREGLSWTDIKE